MKKFCVVMIALSGSVACVEKPAYVPQQDMSESEDAGADMPTSDQSTEMGEDARPDMREQPDEAPDLTPDLGPCGQVCEGANPVCNPDSGSCVACLNSTDCDDAQVCNLEDNTCVQCLQDADCDEDSVCNVTSTTCVECLDNSQCEMPGASVCGVDNLCGACQIDEDCSHLQDTLSCNRGTCVQCTPGTEEARCDGNSCDPGLLTCTDTARTSLERCQKCVSDSECKSGGCVAMEFGPEGSQQPAGSYCLPAPIDNDCTSNTYTIQKQVTTVSGNVLNVCSPVEVLTSCPAILDAFDNETCPQADENNFSMACGLDTLDDGVCTVKDLSGKTKCALLCSNDMQCDVGETCQEIIEGALMGQRACKQ